MEQMDLAGKKAESPYDTSGAPTSGERRTNCSLAPYDTIPNDAKLVNETHEKIDEFECIKCGSELEHIGLEKTFFQVGPYNSLPIIHYYEITYACTNKKCGMLVSYSHNRDMWFKPITKRKET